MLNDLEKGGMIKAVVKGKSKVYSPTEEGEEYIVEKLKDFHAVYAHILGTER